MKSLLVALLMLFATQAHASFNCGSLEPFATFSSFSAADGNLVADVFYPRGGTTCIDIDRGGGEGAQIIMADYRIDWARIVFNSGDGRTLTVFASILSPSTAEATVHFDNLAVGLTASATGTFQASAYRPDTGDRMAAGAPELISGIASAVTHLPEPATYAMMLVGLGIVGAVRRKKK